MVTKTKKKVSKKATKKDKPGRGRPTKYDPAFCEIVIEEMSNGYSKEATAGYLGISKETFYQWCKIHKDFSDAVHIGEVKSQRTWEGKAIDYCVHTKDGSRLDSRIYALQMKNRFGWSDKKEIELGNKNDKAFAFSLDTKPID